MSLQLKCPFCLTTVFIDFTSTVVGQDVEALSVLQHSPCPACGQLLVFIDRGYTHDVTPGDIYTIYRQSPRDLMPVVIGELAVLSVESGTALGKILESRYAVYVGDKLDPK